MTVLGSSFGARISLENGLITRISLERHRKSAIRVQEQIGEATVAQLDEVIAYPEASYTPDVEARGQSNRVVSWYVRQTVNGLGDRKIEIREAPRDDKSTHELATRVILTFNLRQPSVWTMAIEGSTMRHSSSSGRLCADFPDAVTLEIEASDANYEDCDDRWFRCKVPLPAGQTTVAFTISSRPTYRFADTVVLCRPEQVREAAIVLSCLPGEWYPPLIVLPRSPCTEAEYTAVYTEFEAARIKQMEHIGGEIGREELFENGPEKFLDLVVRRQSLQIKLAPFRSWLKHNEMIADVLGQVGFSRAVFLFEPRQQDLRTSAIGLQNEKDRFSQRRNAFRLVPEETRILCFLDHTAAASELGRPVEAHTYSSLAELSRLAWEMLGSNRAAPERFTEVPEDLQNQYLPALYRALRHAAPIRPVGESGQQGLDLSSDDPSWNSDEAVLVEEGGDASSLIAATYAHYRKAPLIVTPTIDMTSVEAALANCETARERVAKLAFASEPSQPSEEGELAKGRLARRMRRLIFGDWQAPAIRQIQDAVTSQIPARVLENVGPRRLTAFTVGVPYSFVHSGTVDWSSKPIGHLPGDASLIVLSEVYLEGAPRSPVTFNLVFDTEQFETSETQDVLESLARHFTHTILLRGENANTDALMSLGEHLPIESIYFNTHGNDQAILLDIAPLNDFQIPQWLTLNSRPVVFNNSCLSWVGVGQEFIRVGARGYIGTLWSVSAFSAADFARTVMNRLSTTVMPVAQAIRKTGIDQFNERAYIYVGTANGFLDEWPDIGIKSDVEYCNAAIDMLLGAAVHARINRGLRGSDKLLYDEASRFIERLEQLAPESFDLVHAYEMELDLLVREGPRLAPTGREQWLVDKCLELNQKLDGPAALKAKTERSVRRLQIRLLESEHKVTQALEQAKALLEFPTEDDEERAFHHLTLARVAKPCGLWELALEQAQQAKELLEKHPDSQQIMPCIGELSQLCKRMGRWEDSLRYAQEGLQKSIEFGDKREPLVFASDIAHAYRGLERWDDAVEAANRALAMNRAAGFALGELKCYGILGLIYMNKGELDLAAEHASTGLKHAKELEDPIEELAFEGDLARVEFRRKDYRKAAEHCLNAKALAAKHGQIELFSEVAGLHLNILLEIGDPEQFVFEAVQLLKLCDSAPEGLNTLLSTILLNLLTKIVETQSTETATLLLGLFATLTHKMAEQAPQAVGLYTQFFGGVCTTLYEWVEGRGNGVREMARRLDQISDGRLGLEELVSSDYVAPPGKPARAR
jgi:tetratricopeptide (TPR) repeat protein